MDNLIRKSEQADEMFTMLMHHMQDAETLSRKAYYTNEEVLPTWL